VTLGNVRPTVSAQAAPYVARAQCRPDVDAVTASRRFDRDPPGAQDNAGPWRQVSGAKAHDHP
jgi:hypothetical protein